MGVIGAHFRGPLVGKYLIRHTSFLCGALLTISITCQKDRKKTE